MRDAPEKTRHSLEMALAVRALVRAAPDSHYKRVIARYVFVHLDDVIRFGSAWRNEVRGRSEPAFRAAQPALERLRGDWERRFADIRDYIGAKRQPRSSDVAADELQSFRLWADIGELSVDTLLDDAVELYSQLAAVCGLSELDYDPIAPDGATEAIQALRPLGEEGFLELTATSFGAGRGPSVRVRMGGEIGRVIPLINDVAEALVTLQTLWSVVQGSAIFERLVRCQLPSELNELLRLSVGQYPSAVSQAKNLLALYEESGMPRAPRDQLRGLRDSITPSTRADLLEWRNKVGAHTDAELPWQEIDESIDRLDVAPVLVLVDSVLVWLDCAACSVQGPLPLLLPERDLRSMHEKATETTASLDYADPDTQPPAPGSPLPEIANSHVMCWVQAPPGFPGSAALAGVTARRIEELNVRLEDARRAS
jgi:hypothetical protein